MNLQEQTRKNARKLSVVTITTGGLRASEEGAGRFRITTSVWVDSPEYKDVTPTPFRFIFRWKYDKDGRPVRQKSTIVVKGFHEVHTGRNQTAPVAHLPFVRLVIVLAVTDNLPLNHVNVRTAFLQPCMGPDNQDVHVIPPEGI